MICNLSLIIISDLGTCDYSQEFSQKSHPTHPQVADGGYPHPRGCQVIIRKAWSPIIVGNVLGKLGECHAPHI